MAAPGRALGEEMRSPEQPPGLTHFSGTQCLPQGWAHCWHFHSFHVYLGPTVCQACAGGERCHASKGAAFPILRALLEPGGQAICKWKAQSQVSLGSRGWWKRQ